MLHTFGELRPADEGIEARAEDPGAQPRVLPQQHRLDGLYREAGVLLRGSSAAYQYMLSRFLIETNGQQA